MPVMIRSDRDEAYDARPTIACFQACKVCLCDRASEDPHVKRRFGQFRTAILSKEKLGPNCRFPLSAFRLLKQSFLPSEKWSGWGKVGSRDHLSKLLHTPFLSSTAQAHFLPTLRRHIRADPFGASFPPSSPNLRTGAAFKGKNGSIDKDAKPSGTGSHTFASPHALALARCSIRIVTCDESTSRCARVHHHHARAALSVQPGSGTRARADGCRPWRCASYHCASRREASGRT